MTRPVPCLKCGQPTTRRLNSDVGVHRKCEEGENGMSRMTPEETEAMVARCAGNSDYYARGLPFSRHREVWTRIWYTEGPTFTGEETARQAWLSVKTDVFGGGA